MFIYDPAQPSSLDILGHIKADIDRNKEKKEVTVIVLANLMARSRQMSSPSKQETLDPESVLTRANNWCARERIKHYVVNAMERASLYDPFISLATKLHPPQTKSTFPQLGKLTQKSSKTEL